MTVSCKLKAGILFDIQLKILTLITIQILEIDGILQSFLLLFDILYSLPHMRHQMARVVLFCHAFAYIPSNFSLFFWLPLFKVISFL